MDSLLREADAEAAHQVESAPVLSEADGKYIRDFCLASIAKERAKSGAKSFTKPLRTKASDARSRIEEWMRERRLTCAVLPRKVLAKAEKELSAKSLPVLPPYVRLVRNNYDRVITTDVIDEAFRSVSMDAILEQKAESGKDALLDAILSSIRCSVRSYREQCSLTKSMQRGTTITESPELPEDIAQLALQLHECTSEAKIASERSKAEMRKQSEGIRQVQPAVRNVLEKLRVTSQNVEVGDKAYKIVRKQSTVKPRLSFTSLRDVLRDVLEKECDSSQQGDKPNIAEWFRTERERLHRALLMGIAAVPASRKDEIVLRRVAEKGDKANGNRDNENENENDSSADEEIDDLTL